MSIITEVMGYLEEKGIRDKDKQFSTIMAYGREELNEVPRNKPIKKICNSIAEDVIRFRDFMDKRLSDEK